MNHTKKTKAQLIHELATLHQRITRLEEAATERRQAEEALLERDTRTRAILEAAVNGIITIDEKGIVESFNQAAERLFGYTAEDVIGQNVSMLMPSPYREKHDSWIARYLATVDFAELDTIIEQADRITRLIERLLTFARTKEPSMEPISLHEPLSRALRLLETRFRREAITVVVEVPADLPPVRGTVDQLEQVFLNIMVNAWHAMPDGGTITIQARETDDQWAQITFRDTGAGMSAADLARAFEPFYSTKEHGTGLGLAISRQIIDSHRGALRLDSTPGEETAVIIELPLGDVAPGGQTLGEKSPIRTLAKRRRRHYDHTAFPRTD